MTKDVEAHISEVTHEEDDQTLPDPDWGDVGE